MSFCLVQALTGLAEACSLFLVACGLSLIFGVTRILNFAHGAFYMLGAYGAYVSISALGGVLGFWPALLVACVAVAALGAIVEMTVLRRVYQAPQLLQLLAAFGVTLVLEDGVRLLFGAEDLVGPRAPGLSGSVSVFGLPFPIYDCALILIALFVLIALWGILKYTRFGLCLRAATQDREMTAMLGVDTRWLFTGVFAFATFLAALGGALALPHEAASHDMDMPALTDALVVIVIGGLGSLPGTFLASILVAEMKAFGILVAPGLSLVLEFVVMACVLVLRPQGLLGQALETEPPPVVVESDRLWPIVMLGLGAAILPFISGNYALNIATEVVIFALYAVSLQCLVGGAGLVSFGHAAYFGLGAYGAALAVTHLHGGLVIALCCSTLIALCAGLLFGGVCIWGSRAACPMLTLAFAKILWALAMQDEGVTGGDNGLIGIWAPLSPRLFFWFCLGLCGLAIVCLRTLWLSPFGHALRALRDHEVRAQALGIPRFFLQWAAFAVTAAFAGLAGGLFVFLKGSVFPDVLSITLSVEGLVMILLGGMETITGAIVGAILFRTLTIMVVSSTDYSRLVIGGLIVILSMTCRRGVAGLLTVRRA